jgi:hypothetical protein
MNRWSLIRCSKGNSLKGAMHGCSFLAGSLTAPNFQPSRSLSASQASCWAEAGAPGLASANSTPAIADCRCHSSASSQDFWEWSPMEWQKDAFVSWQTRAICSTFIGPILVSPNSAARTAGLMASLGRTPDWPPGHKPVASKVRSFFSTVLQQACDFRPLNVVGFAKVWTSQRQSYIKVIQPIQD